MEWYVVGPLIMSIFVALLLLGMPIAFAFGTATVIGFVFWGGQRFQLIPLIAHDTYNSFVLTSVPLFILIAEILIYTRINEDLYAALERWVGWLPGGLGVASILACAGFAATSGSSVATAATMGRVAMPAMLARGYDKRFTTGILASGGTLGILIPPSLTMIIYGIMTETSIARLFIAGVIPGIILTLVFCIFVIVRSRLSSAMAPGVPSFPWAERWQSLPKALPVAVLAGVIMGSIYLGLATPTEAAGLGVLTVLVLSLAYRMLNWRNLGQALRSTVLTSGFIMLIVIGAKSLAGLLGLLEIPTQMAQVIGNWQVSPLVVLLAIEIVFIILGMFMEGMGIIVLTAPVFAPLISALGFDLIWFGVFTTINIELALITPPVGVNVYVIQGIGKEYGITMGDAFRGIVPFCFLMLLVVAIITAFPELATWLPETMMGLK